MFAGNSDSCSVERGKGGEDVLGGWRPEGRGRGGGPKRIEGRREEGWRGSGKVKFIDFVFKNTKCNCKKCEIFQHQSAKIMDFTTSGL